MGGIISPRSERGKYQAVFSNTGGSPKPRKKAPCQKRAPSPVPAGHSTKDFSKQTTLQPTHCLLLARAKLDTQKEVTLIVENV